MTLEERLRELGLTANQRAEATLKHPADVEHLLAKVKQRTDIANRAAFVARSLHSLPSRSERPLIRDGEPPVDNNEEEPLTALAPDKTGDELMHEAATEISFMPTDSIKDELDFWKTRSSPRYLVDLLEKELQRR